MGLAALQAVRPSDRNVSVIRACASRLLVRAERLPIGYGWRALVRSSHAPLIGFPEGAAGMALALLTASALTNDAAAHDVAHHAIDYERSAFVPATKNGRTCVAAGATMRRRRGVVGRRGLGWRVSRGCGIWITGGCGRRFSDAVKATMQEWLWRESLFVSWRSGERGVSGGCGGSIRGCAVAAGCGADCGGCDAGD